MARVVHSKLVCQELLLDGLWVMGKTEALGDATETWISQFENYEINNINFSSYKNHTI